MPQGDASLLFCGEAASLLLNIALLSHDAGDGEKTTSDRHAEHSSLISDQGQVSSLM